MTVHPYIKLPRADATVAPQPWKVADLFDRYSWPSGLAGGGKIAIVELGGAYRPADTAAFCAANGVPEPTVENPESPFPSGDADAEVALDVQVAAAAYSHATGKPAEIVLIWAQDIATGVRQAVTAGADVISISWGEPESQWGEALADMEAAAEAAVAAGVVIFCAAGDNDSSDGEPNNPAEIDAPSACPHVIACGGTTLPQNGDEIVWQNNPGQTDGSGTGGGFSAIFPPQSWQIGAPTGSGRMIPDVSANADPNTGYEIVLHGQFAVVGGTSAVAPLLSGLFAAFGKKIGDVRAKLWADHALFTDIVTGENGFYHASIGPDPCSGIGAITGRVQILFSSSVRT